MSEEAEREAMNPVPSAEAGRAQRPRRKTMLEKIQELQRYTRPGGVDNKTGGAGQPASLIVNYIAVDLPAAEKVKQYRVDFEPAVVLGIKRKGIIREWARQKQLPNTSYTYDGGSIIYAPGLAEDSSEVPFDGGKVAVQLKEVGSIEPRDPQFLQILNVQMLRLQENELKLARVDDGCFDPKAARQLTLAQAKIEVWPGFETAIGKFEDGKLLMSIDQRFKIIRLESALQVLHGKFSQLQSSGGALEAIQAEAAKSVIGHVVETHYNNKTYRVQKVDWSKNPLFEFEVRDRATNTTKMVSLKEYSEKRYGVRINDVRQPVLVVRPQDRQGRRKGDEIMLIPEICRMTGYTDAIKADFRSMKSITEITKLGPGDRKNRAAEFAKRMASNEGIKNQLAHWGVSYGNELLKLTGRNLGMQALTQGNKQLNYEVADADWSRSMRGTTVEDPKSITKWLCIFPAEFSDITRAFVSEMKTVAHPMGIKIDDPRAIKIDNANPESYLNVIRQNQVDKGCQLVFVVFPTNAKDRYDALKLLACCNMPCPSQAILSKTASNEKGRKSIATKVVQQINAKLAGQIWKCNLPFREPTMIVGIDVHRDRQEGRTVVVGAGTRNSKFGNYSTFHEFVADDSGVLRVVAGIIKKCMEAFKKHNKNMTPMRVIVYRDGATDDIGELLKVELEEVKSMLTAESTQKEITLTYVLVNKRAPTRFFGDAASVTNPLPGTVIDHTVTRPERFDFYLVSQSVREGTVAPTYYNCIHEKNSLSPDQLQAMTYLLCHMYFNWPGTIRVPAPCQYARKCAQMIGLNLHKEPSERLVDNLWYL